MKQKLKIIMKLVFCIRYIFFKMVKHTHTHRQRERESILYDLQNNLATFKMSAKKTIIYTLSSCNPPAFGTFTTNTNARAFGR